MSRFEGQDIVRDFLDSPLMDQIKKSMNPDEPEVSFQDTDIEFDDEYDDTNPENIDIDEPEDTESDNDDEDEDRETKSKDIDKELESIIIRLVRGKHIYETGLLEPKSNDDNPDDYTLEELYDFIIAAVNNADALEFLTATHVEDDISSIFLFFDPDLDEDTASSLLLSIREITPGAQVVQKPTEANDTQNWIFLCSMSDIDVLSKDPEVSQDDFEIEDEDEYI